MSHLLYQKSAHTVPYQYDFTFAQARLGKQPFGHVSRAVGEMHRSSLPAREGV
jgi:hypothetical protein